MTAARRAADPGLVANARPASRWTSRAVGTGVCYAVVTALYDRQNFTSAPRMFFELRGSRLYDWRKDETAGGSGNHRWNDPSTWSFTENPVVIEYNYRRGLSVSGDDFCGMFMPAGDLPLDKWTLAANICDEDAGGEPRYRASILIDSGDDHGDGHRGSVAGDRCHGGRRRRGRMADHRHRPADRRNAHRRRHDRRRPAALSRPPLGRGTGQFGVRHLFRSRQSLVAGAL